MNEKNKFVTEDLDEKTAKEKEKLYEPDETDRKIITALVDDPELNFVQLSQMLQISKTTAHNKYKRLKEEKIIARSVKVDRNRMYGDIIVFILIQIVGVNQKNVLDRLMSFKEVEEAAIVTGENDMILRLRLENIYQLNYLSFPNLKYSNIVIKETKCKY